MSTNHPQEMMEELQQDAFPVGTKICIQDSGSSIFDGCSALIVEVFFHPEAPYYRERILYRVDIDGIERVVDRYEVEAISLP